MTSRTQYNPITAYKRKAAAKSAIDDHLSKSNQARPKRVVQSSILDEINKRYPQTVRVRQVPNMKHDRIGTFRFPTDPDDLKAHLTQTPPPKPRVHDFNITDSFRYKTEDVALDYTNTTQSLSKARRKSDASNYAGGLSPMEKKIGHLLHESISKRFEKPVRPKSVVKESNKLAQSGSRIRVALRKAFAFKIKPKTESEEKPKSIAQVKKEIKEQSRSMTSIDQNTKTNSVGRLDTSEDLIALAETLNANDSFKDRNLMDNVESTRTLRDEERASTRSTLSNTSKNKSKSKLKMKKRSSATPSYKDVSEFRNKPVIKISNQYYKPVAVEVKTERVKKTTPEFNKSPSAIENNFDQIMREFREDGTNKENASSSSAREPVVRSLAYITENDYNGLPVIEEERLSNLRNIRNKSTGKEKKMIKHKNTMSMNFMPVYAAKKTVVLPALISASKNKEKKSGRKNIRENLNTEMALKNRDSNVTSLHSLMTEDDYQPLKEEKKKNMLVREYLKPSASKLQVMTPSPRMFTGTGFVVGTSAFTTGF